MASTKIPMFGHDLFKNWKILDLLHVERSDKFWHSVPSSHLLDAGCLAIFQAVLSRLLLVSLQSQVYRIMYECMSFCVFRASEMFLVDTNKESRIVKHYVQQFCLR